MVKRNSSGQAEARGQNGERRGSKIRVEENADLGIETSSPEEYSISSYGADYLVDGLVRRLRDKSIIIPKYQRRYVWKIDRASRFVESLLLNLPVPAIFMMREEETGKLLVIDGQQRLLTLQYYYEGIFKPDERAFKLCGLRSRFEGRSRESLDERDRIALDDSIIHAIIVKQESPPASAPAGVGPSAVYDIFERLNTGGVQLFPQEIRSCIFHGKFIDLLDRLNKDAVWRRLFGGKPSSRLRDQELILRFLALYHDADRYAKPMKEFLNRFAEEHRKLRDDEAARFAKLFEDMVRTIDSTLGAEAFRTKSTINAALFDAVAVGVAKRLAAGPVSDPTDFAVQLQALKGNAEFVTFIESGTTSETSVAKRLALAIEAFASMP